MTTPNESTTTGDLDAAGIAARDAILTLLAERGIADQHLAFYSAAAWKDRGESFGTESALVVVHESAPAGPLLSMDKAYWRARPGFDCYEGYEALQERLRTVGLYLQDCTVWYSAIYPIEPLPECMRTAGRE